MSRVRSITKIQKVQPAHSCIHCGASVVSCDDQAIPLGWLHKDTGNSFCDVWSIVDAIYNHDLPGRTEAETDDAPVWRLDWVIGPSKGTWWFLTQPEAIEAQRGLMEEAR